MMVQVSRWLVEFIGHYPSSNTVEEAIASQFTFLITELLRGIGTASPSSTVGRLWVYMLQMFMSRTDV